MNKFFIAITLMFGFMSSAFASSHKHHSVHHHNVIFPPAVQVTPHGMVVTAPPNADVDVDNDEGDIEIDISPRKKGIFGL